MKFSVIFIFAAITLISCSRGTFPERVDYGSVLLTEADGPVFIITGFGNLDDYDRTSLKASLQLFRTNLVFRSDENDDYSASVTLRYEIFRLQNGYISDRVKTVSENKRITGDPDNVMMNHKSEHWAREFDVPPGQYRLVISVTDQASDKTISRNTDVFVPGESAGLKGISAITLFGIKNNSGEKTMLGMYGIPESYDYLKFSFYTHEELRSGKYTVQMQVVEFEADNTPARRTTDPNLPSSSLVKRGIHYGMGSIVEGSERVKIVENGLNYHEYYFDLPHRGNFRFEVLISEKQLNKPKDAISYSARDFGMRSENFPLIGNAFEMAEPLAYIMTNRQYRELMSIQDPDSLRMAVETFWVSNLGSLSDAREVMAMYYNNVIEANIQFSSFKEGWKTDLGMIYILFGQPWNIDHSTQNIRWTYGYDRRDPDFNFIFVRTRKGDSKFPFDNWILRRNTNYHTVTYRRVQDWLNGYVIGRRHPY
jgi:GWxTD domain-containing protein